MAESSTAGKVYEWDREGRVKSITDLATPAMKIEYLYDADGNRLIERDTSSGSATTHTLNVGSSQIKVNDGSTPVSNTTTTRTYSIGEEAVATRNASGVSLMATDDQGTPLVTVNPNTLAYTKRRLSPFGEQLQSPTTTWPSNKGFLNKTTDSWAGTTHLGAREYDARDGRFISVDPIGSPRDPQSLNGYAYAHNSPVTNSDPSGLFIPCDGSSCPGGSGTRWQPKSKPYMKAYHRNVRANRQNVRHWREDRVWTGAVAPAQTSLTADQWARQDALRGSKSAAEMAKSFARFIVGDERSCFGSSGSAGSCAFEVATLVPFLKWGKLGKVAKAAPSSPKLNRAGRAYPDVMDPRTGNPVHFPGEGLVKVPSSQRVPWGGNERAAFIKEWYDRGHSMPEGGWAGYDIHHIRPREYGGTNDLDNLVPIPREVHQQQFNSWWRDY